MASRRPADAPPARAGWGRFYFDLGRMLLRDDMSVMAGGVAFYGFLALLPGMLAVVLFYGGKPLWALALAGGLTLAFGVVMVLHPSFGVMALVWLFGIQTLAFGTLLIATAFAVKGASRRLAHGAR